MRHSSLDVRLPRRVHLIAMVLIAFSYAATYGLLHLFPPVPDDSYLPWYLNTLKLFPIAAAIYSLALVAVLELAHLRVPSSTPRFAGRLLLALALRGGLAILSLLTLSAIAEVVGFSQSIFEASAVAAVVFVVLLIPVGLLWKRLTP